jgi:hypothetical protein
LVENSDAVDCDPVTFDGSSERYEIIAESIRYSDKLVGSRGLTGTIHKIKNHLRSGTRVVTGQILLEVGPNELAAWLPRILGNAAAGTTYTTSTTFSTRPFDIFVRRDQGDAYYRNCVVNAATLRSRSSIGNGEQQVMTLMLDILGFEEHLDQTWPVTEPALPTSNRLYWLHGDGKLTLAGTEYYFDAFNLTVNNNLIPYTRNHLQLTCLQSGGQHINLSMPTPLTAAAYTAYYETRFEGAAVVSFLGTKNLTGVTPGSAYNTTITMSNVIQERKTPSTSGMGEIPLVLDLEAYRSGTTEPISIVNAIT